MTCAECISEQASESLKAVPLVLPVAGKKIFMYKLYKPSPVPSESDAAVETGNNF